MGLPGYCRPCSGSFGPPGKRRCQALAAGAAASLPGSPAVPARRRGAARPAAQYGYARKRYGQHSEAVAQGAKVPGSALGTRCRARATGLSYARFARHRYARDGLCLRCMAGHGMGLDVTTPSRRYRERSWLARGLTERTARPAVAVPSAPPVHGPALLFEDTNC